MRKRELKNIQWSLLIVALILCVIGLVALFSATRETGNEEFTKQLIWLSISLVIMLIIIVVDYEILVKISPRFIWSNCYFLNSSTVHNSCKWCNKLVWHRRIFISTIRICKTNCNTIFNFCNIKNTKQL